MTEFPRPVRRSRRATGAAVVLALLAPLLAACGGIPYSGDVVTGSEVSQQDPGGTEYIVEGPAEGATAEEILRGFIAAFKSSGDYDVARQFLSSSFLDDWDPRESVLVHNGGSSIVPVSDTALDYVVTSATASVDSAGTYRQFAPAPATLHYEFVQEDGEWRISAAPGGIVLSQSSFENVFSENVLYFLDTGGAALVPDLRWFPAGTGVATRVVSALLAGPPPWLQGAATSSFPAGTQLSSPKRVAIDGTTAYVDLTSEALEASPLQRQRMRLQIESSLGLITSTVISVDGTELSIPDPGPGLPQPQLPVDNRPLILHDGSFGYYANGQISLIDGLSEQVAALAPDAATLASGGSAIAVLNAEGVWVVRREGDPALLDARAGLIAPTLDIYGYTWSVPAGSPTALRAFAFDGTAYDVTTALPPDARVAAIEVSRDGARLAILLATPAGPRLMVSAIMRDVNASNAPLGLGVPVVDASLDSGTAVDLAWMDETTVVTLSESGDDTLVLAHQVGGRRESLGSPDSGVQIVGGNGETGLRVLGEDGVVAARRPSGWQTTQITAEFIATQR
ncbi:LpqB family beta-propeller domain-containing protein [Salinibacterium sp. SYSU T00001]|uniref:LpqB family beta-propeller domain-containing protein n=1 Tax=Homoserinimonas sedimenticola TaxID=2986805 RepID=UPI0022364E66|nr:LpqB family beta-propeller domain-containing protein [Salinibacterium sedimenticola]MCW4384987.1 LpqB family beta-propeller domain-containing protein [Salinibacterium sedimenticola]